MKNILGFATVVLILISSLTLTSAANASETPTPSQSQPRSFGRGHAFAVAELPVGTFRQQLEALPTDARSTAMSKLSSFTFHSADVESLRSDSTGGIYYSCAISPESKAFMQAHAAVEAANRALPTVAKASVPIASPPAYHSKSGATKVIYLDFNGHVVTGTAWNSGAGSATTYDTQPLDTDADPTTFSDAEQTLMLGVWQRIAEDYAPFDVDVTTEEPAIFSNTTGRILITRSTDKVGTSCPSSSAGGVAYIGVFGDSNYLSTYSPAFVYYNNLSSSEAFIAEAASHEMGHNMGLSHDGTSATGYYSGHGTGNTSWAPIMGTGYSHNVSQWSKGEYYIANNTEDDLAIITARVAYRTDDHGGTSGTATALVVTGGTTVSSTTNKGIIEQNTDVDVFSFSTGAGAITLNIDPWRSPANTKGGNLDIFAELYNSTGTLVASSDVSGDTNATFTSLTVTAGTYYLHVKNVGAGTPTSSTPTGYTTYGSIGQYYISGTLLNSPPAITSTLTAAGVVGTAFSYQITASNTPTSFSATGLPSGLTVSTTTGLISGTPLAAATGSTSVTLGAANANGSGTATLVVTVTALPVFTSGPTATPSTVLVGVPVDFSAAASSPIGSALTYGWNFADGTSGAGTTVQHTFNPAGTYTVTCTATDALGQATSQTTSVTVTAATVGGLSDSNGDGVPDSIATALGGNPLSPTPLSTTVTNSTTGFLTLQGNVRAVYSKSKEITKISFNVKFEVDAAMTVEGQMISIAAGNYGQTFQLPSSKPLKGVMVTDAGNNSGATLTVTSAKAKKGATTKLVTAKVVLYTEDEITTDDLTPLAIIFNGTLYLY